MSLESLGGRILEKRLERGADLPLDAFPTQLKVAEFAYMHRSEQEIQEEPAPEKIDGNTVMRWWLKKGLAAEWGRYLEQSLEEHHKEHPDTTPMINVHDEKRLESIVAELRGNKNTLH